MNTRKIILSAGASLLVSTIAYAGPTEDATLNATINGGALEIIPASVAGPFTPTGGAVTSSGEVQQDALVFEIADIGINDLNGDGLGFTLTASPDAVLTSGTFDLPLGTVAGFGNPDAGLVVDDANTATYSDGSGVSGIEIDYTVAYDVPAFAPAGSYSGVVTFAVVSL